MSDPLSIDPIGVRFVASKRNLSEPRYLSFPMACVWTGVTSRSPLEKMGGIFSGT